MATSSEHPGGAPTHRAGCRPQPARLVPGWTVDPAPGVRAPLTITVPADGHSVTRARYEFDGWLAIDVPSGELFDDLVLVVYEALANAADHAYPDNDPGPVRLSVRRSRAALHVAVADRGTWRTPAPPTSAAPAFRGRGLPLIRLLIPDVHVELGSGGTTVHLRAPLPPPVLSPGY